MLIEAHYFDVIKRRIAKCLTTLTGKLKAKWWGVQISKNPSFFGKVYFRRLPGSKIEIGNCCRFNSTPSSNLIGINHPCILSTLSKEAVLIIGSNCGFSGTVIGTFRKIIIGDDVKCGANTVITDSDWHPDDPRSGNPKEVIIGNNVWLGINTIVLKGVSIGENSIIGANSVVTKNIPPNVVAAGNPCKILKSIIPDEKSL